MKIIDVIIIISPGLDVYSVTIVERAEKGLPIPLVNENIVVLTKIGNSFPLA